MSEKATRAAYGEALAELGAVNDKVVVLDADLAHATMTVTFKKRIPRAPFQRRYRGSQHGRHGRRYVHDGSDPLLLHLRHVRRRPGL